MLLGGDKSFRTKRSVETVPGFKEEKISFYSFFTGGAKFKLEHNGKNACGIPDGETIVMTGGAGGVLGGEGHNYVTRWVHGKMRKNEKIRESCAFQS